MKRIVLWGLGNRCAMWYQWFMRRYDVVCLVDNGKRRSDIHGIPVVTAKESLRYDYDAIVLPTNERNEEDIKEIERLTGEHEKVFWLDDFLDAEKRTLKEYTSDYVQEQKKILGEILTSTDEQIHNYQ